MKFSTFRKSAKITILVTLIVSTIVLLATLISAFVKQNIQGVTDYIILSVCFIAFVALAVIAVLSSFSSVTIDKSGATIGIAKLMFNSVKWDDVDDVRLVRITNQYGICDLVINIVVEGNGGQSTKVNYNVFSKKKITFSFTRKAFRCVKRNYQGIICNEGLAYAYDDNGKPI